MSGLSTSFLGDISSWSRKSSFAGSAIIAAFVLGHGVFSARYLKQKYGLDDNTSPRRDIADKGEEYVKEGRITREQLNLLHRNQALHENSMEHFPLFASSVLFALMTGVSHINAFALAYLGIRAGYGASYLAIKDKKASALRTAFWWSGNLVCFAMIVKGARRLVGVGRMWE